MRFLRISLVWLLLSASLVVPMGLLQVFALNGSSTTLISSQNPSAFGQSIIFTASVFPPTAIGDVQFYDTSTSPPALLASVALSGGSATFSTSSLSVGSHGIMASYLGDTNNAPSTYIMTQTVSQIPSTIIVASSQNPSVHNQPLTFTARVSPSTATGTVQFAIDGIQGGSPVALANGVAVFTTSVLSVGVHQITVAYSGNAIFTGSTNTLSQGVNQIGTTTVVTSSQNPSTSGQGVTFTARISSNTATGVVQFDDLSNQSVLLGTRTISGGTASFSTSLLSVGNHSILAKYLGDINDAPSTSSVLTQGVNQNSASDTVTSLSTNATSIIFDHTVTFTARVSPSTATGTVQFLLNGTNLSPPVTLSGGNAIFSTHSLPEGTDNVVASYSGGSNFKPSVSSSAIVRVTIAGSSGNQGSNPATASTNLGTLVSDFVQHRNTILKEQRNEALGIIHECIAEFKNASHGDKKQVHDECKLKLNEARQKYKDMKNQLKQQFEKLRVQFQSKINPVDLQHVNDEKNETQNSDSEISFLEAKKNNDNNQSNEHNEPNNDNALGKGNHAHEKK